MTVHFFSIVLDGLPWITMHYPMMRQLPFEWSWSVVEGVAAPVHCTSWCKPLPPRLSVDGTTEYLDSLAFDGRVKIYRKPIWNGKVEMVNAPLPHIKEPCLLWQIDSDEIWTAAQIVKMRRMFLASPRHTSAQFYCRYFVGPDIVTMNRGLFGNRPYDWLRVWKFAPGMAFRTHEPPVMEGDNGNRFTQDDTATAGLVFDHYAYALESTLLFKQNYYAGKGDNYKNAVNDWRRLQAQQQFPVLLREFFPWVDDNAKVKRI